MSANDLRFLHADQIQLDEQPSVISEFTSDDWQRLQDATLTAFDHLITAAIDQSVHLVLLTGRLFASEGPTLRALVRLKDGLALLEEEQIQVVILPDPAELEVIRNTPWLASNNLHDLSPWDRHQETINCRGNRVVSVVQLAFDEGVRRIDPPQSVVMHAAASHSASFQLAVIQIDENSNLLEIEDSVLRSFDYVGVSGSNNHREFHSSYTTAYAPGQLQPCEGTDHPQTGCLLVEIDRTQDCQTQLLPLTALRERRLQLSMSREADWEQLVQKMKSEMRSIRTSPTEAVCVIHWTIQAYGELQESLSDPEFRSELVQYLSDETDSHASCQVLHLVQMKTEQLSGNPIDATSADQHDLLDSFATVIQGRTSDYQKVRIEATTRELEEHIDLDEGIAQRVNHDRIVEHAEKIGNQCLSEAIHAKAPVK